MDRVELDALVGAVSTAEVPDDDFGSAVDRCTGSGRRRMPDPATTTVAESQVGDETAQASLRTWPGLVVSTLVFSKANVRMGGHGHTAEEAVDLLTVRLSRVLDGGVKAINALREHLGMPEVEKRRCTRCEALVLCVPGPVVCDCDDPEGE